MIIKLLERVHTDCVAHSTHSWSGSEMNLNESNKKVSGEIEFLAFSTFNRPIFDTSMLFHVVYVRCFWTFRWKISSLFPSIGSTNFAFICDFNRRRKLVFRFVLPQMTPKFPINDENIYEFEICFLFILSAFDPNKHQHTHTNDDGTTFKLQNIFDALTYTLSVNRNRYEHFWMKMNWDDKGEAAKCAFCL